MPILPPSPSLAVALAFAVAPPPAHADCIDDAAARHRVNAVVLRAIGWHESRLRPQALGRNANGSIDVGAFQINSIHLPELARHGIALQSLADGCVSAEVAAWHYRRQVEQQGDTWLAVGSYHSHTAARAAWYANRIAAILVRWQAIPAGPPPFPAEGALAPTPTPTPTPTPSLSPSPSPSPPRLPTGSRRRSLPLATPAGVKPPSAPIQPPIHAPPQGVTALAYVPSAR